MLYIFCINRCSVSKGLKLLSPTLAITLAVFKGFISRKAYLVLSNV